MVLWRPETLGKGKKKPVGTLWELLIHWAAESGIKQNMDA